jgi:hypothetical protein
MKAWLKIALGREIRNSSLKITVFVEALLLYIILAIRYLNAAKRWING